MKSAWVYLRRLAIDKLRPPGLHVAMRVRVRRRPLLLLLSGEHVSLSAALHRPRARADRPICTGALLGDNRRRAHVTGWPRPVLLLRRIDGVVGDGSPFAGVQRLTSGSHLRTSVVKRQINNIISCKAGATLGMHVACMHRLHTIVCSRMQPAYDRRRPASYGVDAGMQIVI